MPILDLTVDEVLSTTRAVRKRLDLTRPVERELLEECLQLALQAPTASNTQPGTRRGHRPGEARAAGGVLSRRLGGYSGLGAPGGRPVQDRAGVVVPPPGLHMADVPVHVSLRPRPATRASRTRPCGDAGLGAPGRWSCSSRRAPAGWARCGRRCTCRASARPRRSSASPSTTSPRSGSSRRVHDGNGLQARGRRPFDEVVHRERW